MEELFNFHQCSELLQWNSNQCIVLLLRFCDSHEFTNTTTSAYSTLWQLFRRHKLAMRKLMDYIAYETNWMYTNICLRSMCEAAPRRLQWTSVSNGIIFFFKPIRREFFKIWKLPITAMLSSPIFANFEKNPIWCVFTVIVWLHSLSRSVHSHTKFNSFSDCPLMHQLHCCTMQPWDGKSASSTLTAICWDQMMVDELAVDGGDI
jgi:hypothetical protein